MRELSQFVAGLGRPSLEGRGWGWVGPLWRAYFRSLANPPPTPPLSERGGQTPATNCDNSRIASIDAKRMKTVHETFGCPAGYAAGASASYPVVKVAALIRSASSRVRPCLLLLSSALLLSSCGSGDESKEKGKNGRVNQGPTQVGFVVVQPTSVAQTADLAARVVAFQQSEVRPQVAGIVRRRFFTEGALVRAGQTLYQIDPRLYRAQTNEAIANLNSAQANA